MPETPLEEVTELEEIAEKTSGVEVKPRYQYLPEISFKDESGIGLGTTTAPLVDYQKSPGVRKVLDSMFTQYNVPVRAYKLFSDSRTNEVEEGFNVIEAGYIDRIPPEYREQYATRMYEQVNAHDAEITLQNINQEISDTETISKSSWPAWLFSGAAAGIADPTNWLFATQTMKYANFSAGVLMNAGKTAAKFSPLSAIQNAIIVGSKEAEGIKEWALQTALDTTMMGVFGGIAGGYATKNVKGARANAEAYFRAMDNDVKIIHKVDSKGTFVENVAVPNEGASLSSAAVENINDILKAGEVSFKDSKATKIMMGWASPIVDMVTSKFNIVREFGTELHPHNFAMSGIAKLIPDASAYDFVKSWKNTYHSTMITARKNWIESIGLEGITKDIQAGAMQLAGKLEGTMSERHFMEEVAKDIRRGFVSENTHVSKTARLVHKSYEELALKIKEVNPAFKEHKVSNIVNYLNRIYDKEKILSDPKHALSVFEKALTEQNVKINKLRDPINAVKNQLDNTNLAIKEVKNKITRPQSAKRTKLEKELKEVLKEIKKGQEKVDRLFKEPSVEKTKQEQVTFGEALKRKKSIQDSLGSLGLTPEQRAKFQSELVELQLKQSQHKEKLSSLESDLKEKIKSGDINADLLDGAHDITPEQAAELDVIRRPLNEAKSRVEGLDSELKGAKTEKDKARIRKELKEAKSELNKADKKLLKDVESGHINEDLIIKYPSGRVVLKDPNVLPTLRDTLSEEQIKDVASSIIDNITGMSVEQMSGRIWNNIKTGGNNPFHSRALLMTDDVLEPLLVNDIRTLMGAFTDQASKRIYFDELLLRRGLDPKKGADAIVEELKQQHKGFVDKALEQPKSKARDKELFALDKEFKKAEKQINDAVNAYWGQLNDPKSIESRVTATLKKAGVATFLGNVPILQLPEFFTPLMRFTFDQYVNDGLHNAINQLSKWAKNLGNKEYTQGQFADMGLGVNRYTAGRINALSGLGHEYKPTTRFERFVSDAANVAMNLSGSNVMMDIQENLVGNMASGGIIRSLKKHLRGEKLVAKEIEMLEVARINPEKWAKRMVEGNKHIQESGKSFVANSHLWDDLEAARVFGIGVNKQARTAILLPDPMSMPLIAQKNPVVGVMMQFLSFVFEANNQFTIPLLTNGDGQKWMGTMAMMSMASMVAPLRQLSRGEEPDMRPQVLFNEALNNGAIFGANWEILMRLNTLTDLPPLRILQADRVKRKKIFGLLTGPGGSILDNVLSGMSALANNEINEQDMKQTGRIAIGPLLNWYTMNIFNKSIEGMNLPKTRSQARRLKEQDD